MFPSPYGVSFILIFIFLFLIIQWGGFRLLTGYHSFLSNLFAISVTSIFLMFPSPYGVSFILICVFIFYKMQCWLFSFRLLMEYHSFLFRLVILIVLVIILSFRLLMEYHSFLLIIKPLLMLILCIFSFRLLMEYHSFLWVSACEWLIFGKYIKFPSPYGVSFILILTQTLLLIILSIVSFRLLMEYHSFLS